MRRKTRIWITLSVVLVVAAALWWRLGGVRQTTDASRSAQTAKDSFALRFTNTAAGATPVAVRTNSGPYALIATNLPNAPFTNAFAYRLTNATQPFHELLRSDRAVLLRNALIDTALGAPQIPEHLRAQGDPGAYVVQARGAISEEFRDRIQKAGGEIISYIPNNAYLVRAPAAVANTLRALPLTQAVLPYEPYYKLDSRLLAVAVKKELSPFPALTLVTFPGKAREAREALERLGAEVVGESQSTPLGDILPPVKAPADKVPEIAQLGSVQMLGVHYNKGLLNDLTRVLVRISTNRFFNSPVLKPPLSHYPVVGGGRLTGSNVLVAVADTGVDAGHPDLTGRVFLSPTAPILDYDGHGTHVIGILLGDGTQSPLPPSSTGPAAIGSFTNAVFSGMAPLAKAYVQSLLERDDVLQRNTALTNALISNNSWGFPGDNDYDIFAASYDAAVRDSLPGVTGEQQVAYVFAAGNDGNGTANGLDGVPGSVISPATGKNVITVGASDLPRYITNFVTKCRDVVVGTNVTSICESNQPWLGMTDTNNQVSPYSARGNVGIGYEGLFGRFKPDVVAPGSMLVSTRSQDYQEPDGATNTFVVGYNAQYLAFNQTNLYALGIPANAVRVEILALTNLYSPTNLAIVLGADIDQFPGVGSAFDTNYLRLTPTTTPVALRAGILYFTAANTNHDPAVTFDLAVLLTVTNNVGNYFTVLKKLNEPLKVGNRGYRYEAGTSMAAPAVSGFLANVQEFLRENFGLTNPSPALLKAMLINGARSLSPNYNVQVTAPVNHQGWGIVNMSNTIPSGFGQGTNGPMRIVEQSVTNALATGMAQKYTVTVPNQARSYPLSITLVWTDPPGNPVTGIKLVNDLNLSVFAETTNVVDSTSSSLLWLGNDFPPGSDFVEPILTGSTDPFAEPVTNLAEVIEVKRDYVNNVENIFIRPPLARSYDIVVKGHRVNVQAVNSHSNSLAQDYALVIASGNVASNNNVNLAVTGPTLTNDLDSRRIAKLIPSTNTSGRVSAGLLNQRVGANNPLIVSTNGATNQWSFFTYENVNNPAYKYVAIVTFFPPELSLPRNREADIDLYVARDMNGVPGTNLFAMDETLRSAAIARSSNSVTRLGTEIFVVSNATAGEIFYVGVKSEDQQAANFSILAISSDKPFSSRDSSNNIVAQAIPLFADVPDGSPDAPAGTNLLMLVIESPDVLVQRVYLTNSISHEQGGDLIGQLNHQDVADGNSVTVTLNNHRTWIGTDTVIYDDSDQDDLLASPLPVINPDGPGRLRDFIGQTAFGVWNFSISDNAQFHTGRVEELTMVIQPGNTNGAGDLVVDRFVCIVANGFDYSAIRVPGDATNVEVCVSEIAPDIALEAFIRKDFLPTLTQYDKAATNVVGSTNGFCFSLGLDDTPPLSAGRYFVGVHNPSQATVCFRIRIFIHRGLIPDRTITAVNNNLTPLIDDATTNSFLVVTNRGAVSSVEVDVRLNHPRIADIALHLVNPFGTRVLLAENRGRDTTNGYGVSISNVVVTNFMARVLDDGFEYAIGTTGAPYGFSNIISGWLVDAGDVDVVHDTYGMLGRSHTGTNGVDLNGNNGAGVISTNVATTIGKEYLLSFAYCKTPNTAIIQTAQLQFNGQQVFDFTHDLPNVPTNLMWTTTSYVFRATSTVLRVGFKQITPASGNIGMFIDSVRLDEVQITTNSQLYATFTDDTLKALVPIKFAPPPFGDTNFVGTNIFISGFEGTNGAIFTNKLVFTNANVFTNGETYDGWRVTTNSVFVQTNNVFAYSDTNFLLLRTGSVVRVLSNTVQGKEYVLQFATRIAPRRLIYSTGVDEDAIALPFGSVDSHYFISSNTLTLTTNRAYVLFTNTPPMGAPWVNRNLGDSHWIGINATSPPPGTNFYGFKTKFNLTGYQWTNTTLTGRFQSDGEPAYFRLNGTNVVGADIVVGTRSYANTNLVGRTFTNGFLPGMNTLEIVVTNAATPVTNTAMGIQARFAADAIKAPLLFSNIPPPVEAAVGEVRLAGCYTNYFTALSDEWRVQTVTFVAKSNNVLLQFTGITPGVWLDHVQIRETGRKYYLPEEPMTPFVGQPAFGIWNLEVWDNRLGAPVAGGELLSWRLNLNFVRTNPPFVRLPNGGTRQFQIGTNAVRYFVYDVPCDYGTVSNWLESLTLPYALDLYFNQNTFPLTGATGDFPLLLNTTNGVSYLDVGVAPLFRSGRYFLAVRSTNNVPVDFRLTVGMNNSPCPPPPASIVAVGKTSFGPGGFKVEWTASPDVEFVIEYASEPAGPWTQIPGTVLSGNGEFTFTDDGTLTGGLPPQRFYRLRVK